MRRHETGDFLASKKKEKEKEKTTKKTKTNESACSISFCANPGGKLSQRPVQFE
jgi:hypothetical protein